MQYYGASFHDLRETMVVATAWSPVGAARAAVGPAIHQRG